MSILPEFDQQRNRKYKIWRDRQSHLFGRLLIMHFFEKKMHNKKALSHLKYTKFGKPYLPNCNYDFNISHSGEFVICGFGLNCKIGVDIELVKEININDFVNFFTIQELNEMKSSDNEVGHFYSLWTKKEAVLKADGRGLNVDLSCVKFINKDALLQDKFYFMREVKIDPLYSCFISSNIPILSVNVTKTSLADLLSF